MTTTHLRRLLAGTLGVAALTLGVAGPAAAGDSKPCDDCHGDDPGEPGYDEDLAWLDRYEVEQETTYGQSEQEDTYGECPQEVMAGPNGEGDYRPGSFP